MGHCTVAEAKEHINYLATLAAWFGLKAFQSLFEGKHVKIMINNTTTESIIYTENCSQTSHKLPNRTTLANSTMVAQADMNANSRPCDSPKRGNHFVSSGGSSAHPPSTSKSLTALLSRFRTTFHGETLPKSSMQHTSPSGYSTLITKNTDKFSTL